MKILLIRYHDQANVNSLEVKNVVGGMGVWPPLGLLYLAAILKENGFDVEVLDVLEQGLGSAGARERILKSGADLVGISTTTPEIRGTMEAARFAKEAGARVVLGGPHLGIFLEETLSQDDVDFAIRGDGERPLLSLVQTLGSASPDLSKVPGLAYKDRGQIIANDVYIERDLATLPFPDWSFLPLRSYSRADALSPLATMISARGCPYHCGFCYRSPESVHMRFRDPIAVVDEMEALVKDWGVREIVFCNDTLTLQRSHIVTICEEILSRELKVLWQGATRVDAVDVQMLKLMKRAGCKQLKFGIESGSQEILDLMQKGFSKDQARDALRWCRQEKIRTGAYFIIGYARENERTITETIDFAKELDPDFVMFYAGVPLPDTDFHRLAVEDKKIDPDYWRDYACGRRHDRLNYLIPDMDAWIKRAFREFYGRPSFLVRKAFSADLWLSVVRHPRLLMGIFSPQGGQQAGVFKKKVKT